MEPKYVFDHKLHSRIDKPELVGTNFMCLMIKFLSQISFPQKTSMIKECKVR